MAEAITVEDLEQHFKIPKGALDKEISSDHVREISTFLESWKLVAPHLGLSDGEIEAIENDRNTEEEKRLLMLQKWKQALVFKATYQKLIKALLSIKRADLASSVCQMVMTSQADNSQGKYYQTNLY